MASLAIGFACATLPHPAPSAAQATVAPPTPVPVTTVPAVTPVSAPTAAVAMPVPAPAAPPPRRVAAGPVPTSTVRIRGARKTALSIPDGGKVVPAVPAKPLVPQAADETAFLARMDAILAPLYTYTPTEADLSAVRDAVQAIGAGQAARALEIEGRIQDPAARKLVRWAMLRGDAGGATPAEIEAFRTANSDFPEQPLLRRRAEEAMLTRVSEPKEIKAFFDKSPPQTGAGWAALAAAYLGEGNRAKAQELAAKAWRDHETSARTETVLLNTLGGLLTEADHKARLDRLLMKDIRWAKERTERALIVRRLLPYLSAPEQAKAQARLAVYLRQKDAARAIMSLPAEAMQDWGVYYAVVQINRRAGTDAGDEERAEQSRGEPAKGEPAKGDLPDGRVGDSKPADPRSPEPSAAADAPKLDTGKLKEAWRLLLAAPTDPARIGSPDDWWIERRVSAYGALAAGQPRTAYDLVRDVGPVTVNALKDAQMLAGWIALRHLKDFAAADRHFTAMRAAADGPISLSAAEYWLGRTAQVLGDKPRADKHFRNATPYFDTFYGQLARQTLEPNVARMALAFPAEPSPEERQRFLARDSAKAVMIARRAGLENLVRPFLAHLRYHLLPAPGEVALVAHLSHAMGDTQWSMRTAKAALVKGQNLAHYAFPTQAFPGYQPLRAPPETAFLLGIARQESEFNTGTVSGAGARGVLQVMPATARSICRDYKVRCDIPRLGSDVAYNTMIASAYIGDRLSDYNGSYVMAIAGYNAGPGRVRQWVREFGDPRSADVDPIDWVERIPFEETREYVKKVLANIQVYRARIGQADTALQIATDLTRARGQTGAGQTPGAVQPAGDPTARDKEPATK